MEIEELWAQFKTVATESSRLYKQDVSGGEGKRAKSWKQSIKILQTLIRSVLRKLSPVRRLFLVLTIALAFLAVIGFHFFVFTQELEFTVAFLGLLMLLVLVLGAHIKKAFGGSLLSERLFVTPAPGPGAANRRVVFSKRCFSRTIAAGPLRRLKCVSSRFVEFQKDFESDNIGSKTYFELLDTKGKSFRWRCYRTQLRVFRQPPRKIAMRTSGGNIADVVRRNRQPGLALMAFKRDSANLFQPHNDFSFEGHVAAVYHGGAI
jgi:hypothetical protein